MATYNSTARGCISLIGNLQEAIKILSNGLKCLFTEDCTRIVKLTRRMLPILEELEVLSRLSTPSTSSRAAIEDLLSTLNKASELIGSVLSSGPFYSLLTNDALSSDFVCICISFTSSWSRMSLKDFNVPSDVEQDIHMLLSQLKTLKVEYETSAKRTQLLQDLREASEAFRVQEPASSPPLSTYQPALAIIDGFTTKQLGNDLTFIKDQHELATKFSKWVDVAFFHQIIDLLQVHVPSTKQQRQQTSAVSDSRVVSTMKPPEAAEEGKDKDRVKDQMKDPVTEVKAILNSINNLKVPIAIRLEGLLPLKAAAGERSRHQDSSFISL